MAFSATLACATSTLRNYSARMRIQNSCLTRAQVKAVREIYAGARDPRTGKQIFPGWVRGSEDLPDRTGSWAAYFVDKPEPARIDFWRYWIFGDPGWDPLTFDFDRDLELAERELPQLAAINTDLSRFRRNGGKLLIYQGSQPPHPELTQNPDRVLQRKILPLSIQSQPLWRLAFPASSSQHSSLRSESEDAAHDCRTASSYRKRYQQGCADLELP